MFSCFFWIQLYFTQWLHRISTPKLCTLVLRYLLARCFIRGLSADEGAAAVAPALTCHYDRNFRAEFCTKAEQLQVLSADTWVIRHWCELMIALKCHFCSATLRDERSCWRCSVPVLAVILNTLSLAICASSSLFTLVVVLVIFPD